MQSAVKIVVKLIYLVLAFGILIKVLSYNRVLVNSSQDQFIFVLILPIMITMVYHSAKALGKAHSAAFRSQPIPFTEALTHLAVLSTLRSLYISAGGIGALIGLVRMFTGSMDPRVIFSKMAFVFIPLIYGVLLSELYTYFLMIRIQSLQIDVDDQDHNQIESDAMSSILN